MRTGVVSLRNGPSLLAERMRQTCAMRKRRSAGYPTTLATKARYALLLFSSLLLVWRETADFMPGRSHRDKAHAPCSYRASKIASTLADLSLGLGSEGDRSVNPGSPNARDRSRTQLNNHPHEIVAIRESVCIPNAEAGAVAY